MGHTKEGRFTIKTGIIIIVPTMVCQTTEPGNWFRRQSYQWSICYNWLALHGACLIQDNLIKRVFRLQINAAACAKSQ